MARLAGIERVTVNESIVARVRRLTAEQDGGQQLFIHRVDAQLMAARDADGSQYFNVTELVQSTFQVIDMLV
jgi:hypothetical protein